MPSCSIKFTCQSIYVWQKLDVYVYDYSEWQILYAVRHCDDCYSSHIIDIRLMSYEIRHTLFIMYDESHMT